MEFSIEKFLRDAKMNEKEIREKSSASSSVNSNIQVIIIRLREPNILKRKRDNGKKGRHSIDSRSDIHTHTHSYRDNV